jgi:hypothetical protein
MRPFIDGRPLTMNYLTRGNHNTITKDHFYEKKAGVLYRSRYSFGKLVSRGFPRRMRRTGECWDSSWRSRPERSADDAQTVTDKMDEAAVTGKAVDDLATIMVAFDRGRVTGQLPVLMPKHVVEDLGKVHEKAVKVCGVMSFSGTVVDGF